MLRNNDPKQWKLRPFYWNNTIVVAMSCKYSNVSVLQSHHHMKKAKLCAFSLRPPCMRMHIKEMIVKKLISHYSGSSASSKNARKWFIPCMHRSLLIFGAIISQDYITTYSYICITNVIDFYIIQVHMRRIKYSYLHFYSYKWSIS